MQRGHCGGRPHTRVVWIAPCQCAACPNLAEAKKIFDSRASYRLERTAVTASPGKEQLWALKTTSGTDGTEHSGQFKSDSVVAIGWTELPVDPSQISDGELGASLALTFGYTPHLAKSSARKIRAFINLRVDDIVFICRGYVKNQEKPLTSTALLASQVEFRRRTRGRKMAIHA